LKGEAQGGREGGGGKANTTYLHGGLGMLEISFEGLALVRPGSEEGQPLRVHGRIHLEEEEEGGKEGGREGKKGGEFLKAASETPHDRKGGGGREGENVSVCFTSSYPNPTCARRSGGRKPIRLKSPAHSALRANRGLEGGMGSSTSTM